MSQPSRIARYAVPLLLLLSVSGVATAQKHEKKVKNEKGSASAPVIWHDPGEPAALNLRYGLGGAERAPDRNGKYTFVKEDMEGTSPKFDIEDEHGTRWKVKLGAEPQAETSASRLLWAAGYFVDEDYYLDQIRVTGLSHLQRGSKFVSEDGVVHGARLERRTKEVKKRGEWDWFNNPFVGTKELNGLRVMVCLVNDWDLKTVNNSIYEADGEERYAVTDLGATFGSTGSSVSRSKSSPQDFARSKFVEKVTSDHVDLVMHSRPILITVFNVPNYMQRSHMEKVGKHIPRADAKWIGERLARFSQEQIRDTFRAGGYRPDEIEEYTKTLLDRIAELNGL